MTNEPDKLLLALRKHSVSILHFFLTGVLACLAFNTRAEVQVTRFDPPLDVGAFNPPPEGLPWNTLGVDFNADSEADFRVLYGRGMMSAYFNTPTSFAVRVGQQLAPGFTILGSDVAAVPLKSIIGSNIVSSVRSNFFTWAPGTTNTEDETIFLGDHYANLITFDLNLGFPLPQPITPASHGVLVTNSVSGNVVLAFGDVVNREGVMALRFSVNGQIHYGYIHFDFRSIVDRGVGAGGKIFGWAYETEPDVPIKAVPLGQSKHLHKGIQAQPAATGDFNAPNH